MFNWHRNATLLFATLVLSTSDSLCQNMALSERWLPAATGGNPLRIAFTKLPEPTSYELMARGAVAVRWNGHLLTARMISPAWYPYQAAASIEFAVPAELRAPGLTEIVLWDTERQQPLPYRGWIPVLIPVKATVFEAAPDRDRLVAAVAAEGTPTGASTIASYRLSTGTLTGTRDLPPGQRVLAFTPDTLYAWVAEDETHGRIARVNLETGETDQVIQVTDGTAPATLAAEPYRPDPRFLMVSVSSGTYSRTTAYLNGVALPNAAPERATLPSAPYDGGRVLLRGQIACAVSVTAGFVNCSPLSRRLNQSFLAAWGGRGVTTGGDVIDLETEDVLLHIGRTSSAAYFPDTRRIIFGGDDGLFIGSGDTLELWAQLDLRTLLDGASRPLVLPPDWLLLRTTEGILAGRVPQLGPQPAFPSAGVVNAASGRAGPIAPGEIISIYGTNLGPPGGAGPVLAPGLRLASDVEGTQVLFNGVPGPILYAGSLQVNTVVPEDLQAGDPVEVQIVRYGIPSARVRVDTAPFSPGTFTYAAQGRPYAAAQDGAGRVQGPDWRLRRGDVAVLWATGLGLPAGAAADSIGARPAEVPVRPLVTIGGRPAQILYAGVSPGLTAGLTQINILVPEDAPSGSAIEVGIRAGSSTAGDAWVAVQ